MDNNDAHTMKFKALEGDFDAAHAFVEGLLNRADINDQVAHETLIVFEALFQKLLDLGLPESTEIDISRANKLGGFSVMVGFEGKPFNLYSNGEDSIEDKIIRSYDDKLDCSYRAGYNLISVSVSRSYRTRLFACALATLAAVVVYLPLHFLLDDSTKYSLLEDYLVPVETMFANITLMVGAPITFFSLLKNLTDTYVVSQRNSDMRRLKTRTIATSVVAILLAIVAAHFWSIPFAGLAGLEPEYAGAEFNRTFAEIVTSSAPSNIFEPFETISPIPLMLVALLVTYALCSAGKHFDMLRGAMEACYTLFSRMLYVVTATLPLFCFLAFLEVLLTDAFWSIPVILGYLFVLHASLILLIASYAVQLRAHGIKPIPFARKLIPLIRENIKIGSAIDATSYNVRYCARTYGLPREKLERNLPVLAQINLDGNCFLIMLIGLIFVFITGTRFTAFDIVILGALVLLLSVGAPNQPGSILIGTLIITAYLHSYDLICVAIYLEAFLGTAQNMANVIGDIVTVAIDESDSIRQ